MSAAQRDAKYVKRLAHVRSLLQAAGAAFVPRALPPARGELDMTEAFYDRHPGLKALAKYCLNGKDKAALLDHVQSWKASWAVEEAERRAEVQERKDEAARRKRAAQNAQTLAAFVPPPTWRLWVVEAFNSVKAKLAARPLELGLHDAPGTSSHYWQVSEWGPSGIDYAQTVSCAHDAFWSWLRNSSGQDLESVAVTLAAGADRRMERLAESKVLLAPALRQAFTAAIERGLSCDVLARACGVARGSDEERQIEKAFKTVFQNEK